MKQITDLKGSGTKYQGVKIRLNYKEDYDHIKVIYCHDYNIFAYKYDCVLEAYEEVCLYKIYDHDFWYIYEPPKKKVKIKMAQAILVDTDDNSIYIPVYLFSCYEKIKERFRENNYKVIQWPLVINGVEQWIEVEE